MLHGSEKQKDSRVWYSRVSGEGGKLDPWPVLAFWEGGSLDEAVRVYNWTSQRMQQ